MARDDDTATAADAAQRLADCQARVARGEAILPVRTLSSGDACFSSEAVVRIETSARARDTASGTLSMTTMGLFVAGTKRITCGWGKVVTIEREDRAVIVHTHRQTPYVVHYPSVAEAELHQWLALALWRANAVPAPPPFRRAPNTPKLAALEISTDDRIFDCGDGSGCRLAVVGESQYQAALRKIDGGRCAHGEQVSFIAELVLEPDNPYDAKAIKVCASDGALLGYLPREEAVEYQISLQALKGRGQRACCRARLIGGTTDKPSIGVMLDVRDPHRLLSVVTPLAF